jgi:hypothetical protein
MKTALIRSMRYLGIVPMIALCFGLTAAPANAQVSVGVSISVGTPPPPLIVYQQPYVPGPDYIWTPGYWEWGDAGYFWVPGAWVLPPEPGLLWTPGYWDNEGDEYGWHPGYWANNVGYYGGINYGFGYFGNGYVGGRWQGGHFRYNTAVTRVNTQVVHNVYVDRQVVISTTKTNRVSYHGGKGGIAVPPPTSRSTMAASRRPMTETQRAHVTVAGGDRNQAAAVTHGHPKQLAVAHPFNSHSRPTTYAPVRPQDRVAPSTRKAGTPSGKGGQARPSQESKKQ